VRTSIIYRKIFKSIVKYKKMKIIAKYLVLLHFGEIVEVVELENGSYYRVNDGYPTYKKIDPELFYELRDKSKEL